MPHETGFSRPFSLVQRAPAPDSSTVDKQRNVLIMLTSGNDDNGKRATLAFSAANSAIAMEHPTALFLVGDGTHWAYTGNIKGVRVAGFPALYELMEQFMDQGGDIMICSTCSSTGGCSIDASEGERRHLLPGILQAGFPTVVSLAHAGASLTF